MKYCSNTQQHLPHLNHAKRNFKNNIFHYFDVRTGKKWKKMVNSIASETFCATITCWSHKLFTQIDAVFDALSEYDLKNVKKIEQHAENG